MEFASIADGEHARQSSKIPPSSTLMVLLSKAKKDASTMSQVSFDTGRRFPCLPRYPSRIAVVTDTPIMNVATITAGLSPPTCDATSQICFLRSPRATLEGIASSPGIDTRPDEYAGSESPTCQTPLQVRSMTKNDAGDHRDEIGPWESWYR